MVSPKQIPLAKAEDLARRIVDEFEETYTRIQVVGAIRRRLEAVDEVELVILPKPRMLDRVERAFRKCLGAGGLILDGALHKAGLLRNCHIRFDLWIARHKTEGDLVTPSLPCNYGAQLLAHTGSDMHNLRLSRRAASMGKELKPGWGVMEADGTMHSMTEEEIYAALGMEFVPPENRD